MEKRLFTLLSGVTFLTIMCCMLFYNVVSLIKVDSISTSHNNCINSEKCVYCIKQNCYVCFHTFHRGKKNQTNKQTKMLHYINQYMFCTLSHLLINKNKRKTVSQSAYSEIRIGTLTPVMIHFPNGHQS